MPESVDELFINQEDMLKISSSSEIIIYLAKYGELELDTLAELIHPLSKIDIIERCAFLNEFNIVNFDNNKAWLISNKKLRLSEELEIAKCWFEKATDENNEGVSFEQNWIGEYSICPEENCLGKLELISKGKLDDDTIKEIHQCKKCNNKYITYWEE